MALLLLTNARHLQPLYQASLSAQGNEGGIYAITGCSHLAVLHSYRRPDYRKGIASS